MYDLSDSGTRFRGRGKCCGCSTASLIIIFRLFISYTVYLKASPRGITFTHKETVLIRVFSLHLFLGFFERSIYTLTAIRFSFSFPQYYSTRPDIRFS